MPVKRYRLACGCEPGFFACLEAQKLWKNTLDLMRLRGTTDKDYIEARSAYDEHIEETEISEKAEEALAPKKGKGFSALEY